MRVAFQSIAVRLYYGYRATLSATLKLPEPSRAHVFADDSIPAAPPNSPGARGSTHWIPQQTAVQRLPSLRPVPAQRLVAPPSRTKFRSLPPARVRQKTPTSENFLKKPLLLPWFFPTAV